MLKKLHQEHGITSRAWSIWLVATLFYAFEFYQRVSPSELVSQLTTYFDINATGLAIFGSAFYWAYALMQIPAGLMVDKYGARRMLSFGAAVVGLGTIAFVSTHNVWAASSARFLVGLGSAYAFVGSLKLIANWFPSTHFALLAGMANFIGYLGGTMAGKPLEWLIKQVDWHNLVIMSGLIGLGLAILIWLVVRDAPPKNLYKKRAAGNINLLRGLKEVLAKPQTWYNGLYGGLMVGPTSTFAALWGVPYLTHVDHVDKSVAATAVSIIFIGVAIGSPLSGWISDKLQLRRMPLIVAAFGALFTTLAIMFWVDINTPLLYVLCFLFGVFQSTHVLNFAICHEINRPAASGSAIGFTNMAVMLGGALFQPIAGLVMDWNWQGHIGAKGVHLYLPHTYELGLIVLPIAQVAAILIAIFLLRETHCKIVRFKKQRLGEGFSHV